MRDERIAVEIEDKQLHLSRLDKVFYPKTGFTKGEVIDYYVRVAPVLLPHLRGRPLTLKRYPNGVEGEFFYQKDAPSPRPKWFRTANVWSEHRGEDIRYCVVDDLASLVWLVNLADLEFHAFLHRAKDVERPTAVAFDLDPGPGTGLVECSQVALILKRHLAGQGLEGYAKTSGSKGMQLYVPLNTPTDYDRTKSFARKVAETLQQEHPDLITSIMRKDLRKGKVFIDWSQNDDHKTTVCVYSLRARERPFVSTPLEWSEVAAVVRMGDGEKIRFETQAVLDRIRISGDRFAPVLKQKQRLPGATRRSPHGSAATPRREPSKRRKVAARH